MFNTKLDVDINYLISFLLAFFLSLAIVPFIKKLGVKYNFVDKPEKRKVHQKAMVRIGGLAIALSFFTLAFINQSIYLKQDIINIYEVNIFKPFLLIALIFFLLGFIDDLLQLSPFLKLIGQIFLSTLAWQNGLRIESIDLSFFSASLSNFEFNTLISLLITILWISGIINSINWFDGLDGLAAGIACIYFSALFFISLEYNYTLSGLCSISLVGSCLGFLRYNFFPSRLFMGDCGSYFLGFTIASLPLIIINSNLYEFQPQSIEITSINLFFIIFSVPILDMTIVILQRIRLGKSAFHPDNRHIHHRLQISGISHRSTVLFCYCICLWTSILGLILVNFEKFKLFFLITNVLVILFIFKYKKSLLKTLKLIVSNSNI